ncbi:hypothetical protein V8C43DRAFT_266745 [Trichoderma afarasin]
MFFSHTCFCNILFFFSFSFSYSITHSTELSLVVMLHRLWLYMIQPFGPVASQAKACPSSVCSDQPLDNMTFVFLQPYAKAICHDTLA